MLLSELKVLETDRRPLQQAVGQLGLDNITNQRKEKAKDSIDTDYRPLIDLGVAQMVPSQITDEQLKKIAPNKQAINEAIDALASCKSILRQQQDHFSRAISTIAAVQRLASPKKRTNAAATKQQVTAWLDAIENQSLLETNDYVASRKKEISDLLNADRIKLINALMDLTTATTWAEASAKAVRNIAARRNEAQDYMIREMIENFHAVIGQMYLNAGIVGTKLEEMRDAEPQATPAK